MAASRFSSLRSLRLSGKLEKPFDVRHTLACINRNDHISESVNSRSSVTNGFVIGNFESTGNSLFKRLSHAGGFGYAMLHPSFRIGGIQCGIGHVRSFRSYSSSADGSTPSLDAQISSGDGGNLPGLNVPFSSDDGGNPWIDKVKDVWKSTIDVLDFTREKAKEASAEVTPYVQNLLDTHPYLNDVVIPVVGTLTATLLAWAVLPKFLKKLHKYSMQGPATLLSNSSLWGPVPYEKSIWGALEDPVRYLITFMAFMQIGMMVAPTTIASQYIGPAWKGAVIVSSLWFLNRWKTNVLTRALEGMVGVERNRLLTVDKVSSVALFVLGSMAFAEVCGVPVQSILTVGGVGGVAAAFAARDILGNILSGLSVQISQPFLIGDTIKAGSVEGQVVEMGLTTTSLLTAEKFPAIVPNSLFSSQVIVNKSRAQWRSMATKIPLQTEDFDKIPKISDDIKSMLKDNPNVFLEKEAPYCYLSRVERSFAELTLGCNLKFGSKEQFFKAQQDILLQSVNIIKQHGATLSSFL